MNDSYVNSVEQRFSMQTTIDSVSIRVFRDGYRCEGIADVPSDPQADMPIRAT